MGCSASTECADPGSAPIKGPAADGSNNSFYVSASSVAPAASAAELAQGPPRTLYYGQLLAGKTVLADVQVLLRWEVEQSRVLVEEAVSSADASDALVSEWIGVFKPGRVGFTWTSPESGSSEPSTLGSLPMCWSGTAKGPGGVVKLQHIPPDSEEADMFIELLPEPYLYHFAVAAHKASGGELLARIQTQLQALCKPGRRLRFWSSNPDGDAEAEVLALCNSYLAVLTPDAWKCPGLVAQLEHVASAGRNVILVCLPPADVHVPKPPTSMSPLEGLSSAVAEIGAIIAAAPPQIGPILEQIEILSYRRHPHGERAVLRHIAALASSSSALALSLPPDVPIEFFRSSPSEEETPEELRGADLRYYEGIAVRTKDDDTEVVRGAYQIMATFNEAEGLIDMDVDYEAQGEKSMPSYHKPRQLQWDSESGEVTLLTEVPNVSAWATWEGTVEGKGGLFTLEEGEAELLFRPMPFMWHYCVLGAGTPEAAVLANIIDNAMERNSAAGRHARVVKALTCGPDELDERRMRIRLSACMLLLLTPGVWDDATCLEDIDYAQSLGKQVLIVHDPDQRMSTFVPLNSVLAAAPLAVKSLISKTDVFPFFRREHEQQALVDVLLTSAGFTGCIKRPYYHEPLVYAMEEQKADANSLIVMSEGRWVYYEGIAERSESGNKWGVYQIDVKFYPDRDYVEMWVEFESYLPGSIPSYKDCFKLDWDEGKQYVQKRGGGWHGDVAGIGQPFHLINWYGDHLTFEAKPFIWHYFLSHIQRESSDLCGLIVAKLKDLSQRGKRVRTWYDNKAGIITKTAMHQGIEHSQNFCLFLSPSVLKSVYVKFEIAAALSLNKNIILLHHPDPKAPAYVDLDALKQSAPDDLKVLFDRPILEWPGATGDVKSFIYSLMAHGGFADIQAEPEEEDV